VTSRSSALASSLLTIAVVAVAAVGLASAEQAEPAADGASTHRAAKTKRWRPTPPPRTPEEAEDPRVAEAMRSAPPIPDPGPPYIGRDQAMSAARRIRSRVGGLTNFRAAIALGHWETDPAHRWRIRPRAQCLQNLRATKVRYERFVPDEEDEEQPEVNLERIPTPVFLRGAIEGVRFVSYNRPIIISCELASRLPVLARVMAEHDVDVVVFSSTYRLQPRSSFHTLGMGLDIPRMRTTTPHVGPDGETARWLSVEDDFIETPDQWTCDPELLADDSMHGDNDRGRRLLSIACSLYRTGIFASVLTPNYNPGHRDHFHVDIRPDDPRTFLR